MRTVFLVLFLFISVLTNFAQAPVPAKSQVDDVLQYIANGWTALSRSDRECDTFVDKRKQQQLSVLYFPAGEPLPSLAADLVKRCNLQVTQLPQVITGPGQFKANAELKPGVLFLPNPYVVPGGFFNEMYGWDSYFIIRGLLEDGKIDLARGQVENFFYEIEHYGSVLNANRTYFLTRSQPPFLSEMVMAVNSAEKQQSQQDDKAWLAKAYPYIIRDWKMWTSGEHLAGNTGLSRYFDYGSGPSPELSQSGDPYYAEMITAVFAGDLHTDYLATDGKWSGPAYKFQVCNDSPSDQTCAKTTRLLLTDDYYEGDRAMRESGFDVSSRFGPYSGHTHHYAPVCLNSLLYQTEENLESIATILGKNDDAKHWGERARHRSELMNKYLWNPQKGMYFDYDFMAGKQSNYIYATTFYPLWVKQASTEQARAVEKNVKVFEQPGGIVMSTVDTKLQWDYPYGWAPINLIAIEGLRKNEDDADANRLSRHFLSMIVDNFHKDGTIREKYNVVTRSDEQDIAVGYHVNVIGFGWTNGSFLVLYHELPQQQRTTLASTASGE
ncbi:MAG TPA: trehalase family glycosidase [Terriglobales bacterium]|nr:trehalase family glycosidase [Terriglobales bacterium]